MLLPGPRAVDDLAARLVDRLAGIYRLAPGVAVIGVSVGVATRLPLQRNAGAAFSWLAAEQRWNKNQLTPVRPRFGELGGSCTRTVFRGRVSRTQVSLLPADATPIPPKAEASVEKPSSPALDGSAALQLGPARTATLPPAPAESRPVTVSDDPNKGRFGTLVTSGGHALSASFTKMLDSENWVDVHLRVDADSSLPSSFSDVVVFFLHPTFNPNRVSVAFRGHTATLTVRAWGGFTVGAWLPHRGVELECDLAAVPGAPRIIREL